ncbi:kinesin [Tremella mesenterica]|uniref:Kinesin n=1 Tax=Tremella mesenterica TaxID=5217 RepID=A0A4Q1BVE1_TREME|nr:kinesin [Tremella mesenterica]
MEDNQTILEPPEITVTSSRAVEKKPQVFSFDKSYWSAGPRDEPQYASQQTLYEDLGVELLDHSFEGFNTCIFAYGQTGSGKSYSMMGYGADKGIIPLTTSELFNRVESRMSQDTNLSYTVEVSYIEIYNEKVRDLLNPKNKGNLRVREHPSLGPYVEDLSKLVVENYSQMMTLMDEGNKARTVASTNMNETSSRSHAVFTLILTQKRLDPTSNMTGEKVSKISLVDLAGSERQASTGATGTRLKEGANINKSLTTLGKVIAALAQASNQTGKKKKDDHVPYRDSVLTWLLKESLGGNSKTAMIAAISPADCVSFIITLRYADAAKKIKTHAVVNEDPNAKLIRELKEELEMLRSRVSGQAGTDEASYDPNISPEKQIVTYRTKDGEIRRVTKLELQDQLQASEKLMDSLNQTWEQKMVQTQAIHVEREKALEEMGITIDKNLVGVHAPQKHPSLVNLNEADPLMSECLVYQLKPGTTIVGSVDDDKAQIRLSGPHILPEHCIFSNVDGVVTLEAMPDARTFVNGKRVPPKSPVKLLNGFRVILGDFHVFRFNDPGAVRAQRRKLRESASVDQLSADNSPGFRSESPYGNGKPEPELMDWSAARREVADIEKLGDQDLDKLFDDIIKVRTQRKRPESRADLATELESRLMVASNTEDSLVDGNNPWATMQGTTLTSNSIATPGGLDLDQAIIEEISETDTEHPFPIVSVDAQKVADAALEQEHLTRQLRDMAQQVRLVKSQAAVARALERTVVESANWSAKELRLVKWAVERWKRLRSYTMAEEILKGAVDVREANVIAHEMGKPVSYNFLISRGASAGSVSSLDDLNGVVEFEDVSNSVGSSISPGVRIKVIDRNAQAVYVWDLARFHQQFTKMRHVHALKQRPNYTLHFRTDEAFTDNPAPTFSFIGSAKVSLNLLAKQVSYSSTVPILCPYTMEAIGSCLVDIKCPSSTSSGITTPDSMRTSIGNSVAVGTKLTFTITVDKVKGLTSVNFSSVHAQTRLSSLVGPSVLAEDTFASLPVDLKKTSVAHLSLRRTVSIIITPEILSFLQENYATIDFFAKVTPEYMNRLERWDRVRETSPLSGTGSITPNQKGDTRPEMRRCETEFISSQHHDILSSLEIRELSSSGEYVPSEVIDNIFQLHQGLQRQLIIKLHHSSGRSLPWRKLTHVSTSDVRVIVKGNISSVSKPEVEVKLSSQSVDHHTDGTTTLSALGFWDTASHHSNHLDKKTPSDQYILIRVIWAVEVENLDEPAMMSYDLPLRILGRDAKRSSFFNFWGGNKVHNNMTVVYSVDLAPPLARSTQDLWRLDTAKKHVKGEEILGDWRPRSLSLLEDFERLIRAEHALADVQSTKAILSLFGETEGKREMKEDEKDGLLRRCMELWKMELDGRIKINLYKDTAEEMAIAKKYRKMIPELEPKLVPSVKQVTLTQNIIKSGPMMLLRDSQKDHWEKLVFLLRRPYLCVHEKMGEREVQIINLSKASVAPSPDVEILLGHKFAFTIFTPTNSYIVRTATQQDMNSWMSVISTSAEA